MTLSDCAFQTARLTVEEWHRNAERSATLPQAVAAIMTERVTSALPDAWQVPGGYTRENARQWIAARDAEVPTLLVRDREAGTVLGFLILFAVRGDGGTDVRIGYVLAEHAWGRGLGSELIEGFVRSCRSRPAITSLSGGVERSNPASALILQKSGFVAGDEGESGEDSLLYRLQLA